MRHRWEQNGRKRFCGVESTGALQTGQRIAVTCIENCQKPAGWCNGGRLSLALDVSGLKPAGLVPGGGYCVRGGSQLEQLFAPRRTTVDFKHVFVRLVNETFEITKVAVVQTLVSRSDFQP
jgi:hypothetical protein